MSERFRFNQKLRIRTRFDFRRIFKRRCSVANDALVVYVDHPATTSPRIGVRAGKRLGNAVTRNRIRRCVKEAFRLAQHDLPVVDMIVIPRHARANVADYQRGLVALANAGQRKLMRNKSEPPRHRDGSRVAE